MQAAAQHLVGEHDFSSFRAAQCQSRTPMRNMHEISVARHGELVILTVCANAFLHHMVRNIAGVLIAIGTGERPLDWSAQVLAYKDRKLGGVTAVPGRAVPGRHPLRPGLESAQRAGIHRIRPGAGNLPAGSGPSIDAPSLNSGSRS